MPGIGGSLLLSLVSMPLGTFLAGGTGLLIAGVEKLVLWTAGLPWASFWVARGTLVAALVGGGLAHLVVRQWLAGRVRPGIRRLAAVGSAGALVLLVPLVPLGRVLEVHVIDVGQGDAIALRFPSGRWILVDAGPRSAEFDAGARRVVPYLKRWGVRRLDAVVLTHPHLDHIGGAPAVLRSFAVEGVLDPSRAYGSDAYLEVLDEVGRRRISWWGGRRRERRSPSATCG
ncbi:MAG: MBL fold metallo-hydrolase [Gemmatimonadetes bacterium]|nr:MBL fold metallo-hydrolase [Gemmatimonadota bacterium]